MKISEELRDRLVNTLYQASSVWYDGNNGPWGFECPFCCRRSEDGYSSPPHNDDCEISMLIKELNELE